MDKVVALVLAGGNMGDFGVLTQNRAKGALTFAGSYRIIDFALSNLVNSGISRIGLLIQYLPSSMIEHVGIGEPWGLNLPGKSLKIMPPFVGIHHTSWYKGTGDAIYQNFNFIDMDQCENIIILSGEHVHSLDYESLVRSHTESDADVTIVTKEINDKQTTKRFGYLTTDENGKVLAYHEKPKNFVGNVACTGTYVFKTSVLNDLLLKNSTSEEQNLAKDILQKYIASLNGREFRMESDWEYLENVYEYYEAQFRYALGEGCDKLKSWNIQTNFDFRSTGHQSPTQYTASAEVHSSFISNGCVIDGKVINSILSPGVIVGKNAVIKNSIIMHDCIINEKAELYGVISDRDAQFGSHSRTGVFSDTLATQENLVLIGKNVHIGPNVIIGGGAQVRSGKHLDDQISVAAET